MLNTRSLTIMFTDIVGYTARTAQQSRAEQVALLQRHDRLLQPLIRQFGGTLVKTLGDGLLVTFRSATMGLRCAMAIQDALADFNRDQPTEQQLHLRIGLAAGDVQLQQGDVFGEAVSVASRIEGMTPPDEIHFAASVYLAMNKAEIQSEFVSRQELKGIPVPVEVYRVLPQGLDGRYHSAEGLASLHDVDVMASRRRAQLRALAAGLAVVMIAVLAWLAPPGWLRAPMPAPPDTAEVFELPSQPTAAGGDMTDPKVQLNAIEALLAQGQVEVAQQVLRDLFAASEASAAMLLAQGHLGFATKHRETGADSYRKALELAPELAENPRLAANLVSALGWETRLARELLERYRSASMIEALAARTAEPGYWGRLHAGQVLEAIGQSHRIRRVDSALLDLREGEDCAQRRAAVQRLGELGDRRVLPALQGLAQMSLLQRLTGDDACLVQDARAAVARITAQPDAQP
jgi:serine/threonine-protein kinase